MLSSTDRLYPVCNGAHRAQLVLTRVLDCTVTVLVPCGRCGRPRPSIYIKLTLTVAILNRKNNKQKQQDK